MGQTITMRVGAASSHASRCLAEHVDKGLSTDGVSTVSSNATTSGNGHGPPPGVFPPTPAPALADLPLVSIHSVFKDSFVRVNARGGLRADAEFPWSYECWYRLLPEVCAQDAGGAAAPGEQQQPPPGEPAAAADDDPDAELERRLGSIESSRAGSTGSARLDSHG